MPAELERTPGAGSETRLSPQRSPGQRRRSETGPPAKPGSDMPAWAITIGVLGALAGSVAVFLPAAILSNNHSVNLAGAKWPLLIPPLLLGAWLIPPWRRTAVSKGLAMGAADLLAIYWSMKVAMTASGVGAKPGYGMLVLLLACAACTIAAILVHLCRGDRRLGRDVIASLIGTLILPVAALLFVTTVHWFSPALAWKYSIWPEPRFDIAARSGLESPAWKEVRSEYLGLISSGNAKATDFLGSQLDDPDAGHKALVLDIASRLEQPLIDDPMPYLRAEDLRVRDRARRYLLAHPRTVTADDLVEVYLRSKEDEHLGERPYFTPAFRAFESEEDWATFARDLPAETVGHIVDRLEQDGELPLVHAVWNATDEEARLEICSVLHLDDKALELYAVWLPTASPAVAAEILDQLLSRFGYTDLEVELLKAAWATANEETQIGIVKRLRRDRESSPLYLEWLPSATPKVAEEIVDQYLRRIGSSMNENEQKQAVRQLIELRPDQNDRVVPWAKRRNLLPR